MRFWRECIKKLEIPLVFLVRPLWYIPSINPTKEEFRVNARIQQQLADRKRRIGRRLDKTQLGPTPALGASNIRYEISDRAEAISAGGIGLIHQMVQTLKLDSALNSGLAIFKLYLPYTESDHILNIAYNLLAGGGYLEHLELRRNDEAYLDALGARRIPDPTTAGDFCRRFERWDILTLMEIINRTRLRVWAQQPASFFEQATIEADGTMVTTYGECKEGMDINHKGEWGYHPLVMTLAETGETLYIHNRSGNRPSHECADVYFDLAINLCRDAGFRRILLRGDTDFTQTAHLDRWHEGGVEFVFGIDAMPNLYEIAENLPETAWKRLRRPPRYHVRTRRRARREKVKQRIVEQRGFTDIQLQEEQVAEFKYQPCNCGREYRVIVVRKALAVCCGQAKLFDDSRCFFYITNTSASPSAVVLGANKRCDQENTIQQLKSDVRALTAPLDNLESNWAYMVCASLASSLKAWFALLLPEDGRQKQKSQEKRRLLRMDFTTFRNAIINIPAQIVRSGRRLIYRLLAWNPWQDIYWRLVARLQRPIRC
jgi:hypothetical protein